MALLLATYALISGPALAADSTETKVKGVEITTTPRGAKTWDLVG